MFPWNFQQTNDPIPVINLVFCSDLVTWQLFSGVRQIIYKNVWETLKPLKDIRIESVYMHTLELQTCDYTPQTYSDVKKISKSSSLKN